MLRISAVICTYNRQAYLKRSVASLLCQTLPAHEYQVIVVDNGSSDATGEMVRREFSSVSNLRYIWEPRVGLSEARNTGWNAATGEYVAYLDDDAVASEKWLENIVRAFGAVVPEPGCVGGKIVPVWESPRPVWVSSEVEFCVGALDLSDRPFVSWTSQVIAGGNAAYQRSVLAEVGGFNTALGRKGFRLLSNEEIHLWQKIRNRGYCAYYDPGISIYHSIPSWKLRKGWFLRRMFWEGVSIALTEQLMKPRVGEQEFHLSLRQALKLLGVPKDLLHLIIPTNDPHRFARRCMAFQRCGYRLGLAGLTR